MAWIKLLALVLLGLALLLLVAGQLGALAGSEPTNLGLRDGKLKPPAKTPNSVSSQADLWPEHPMRERARIAPLALAGDGAATLAKLERIVAAMPGAKVVKREPGYLYAQFTTQLLKFTDDLEFWFDEPAGVVQVRSASRIGHGDRGVNRVRVEDIRARLAAAP